MPQVTPESVAKPLLAAEAKPAITSRTVIGGLVAAGASLAALVGHSIDPATQASLTDLILQGASLVGGALAIYGRFKATRIIK